MPSITVKALKVDEPGNSLATWLAAHHPDLFLALFKKAQAANMKKGIQKLGVLAMGRLADEAGTTTTFDTPASDPFSDPGLTTVTYNPDYSPLPSNLLSDTGDGSGFLSSVASGVF